MSLVTIPPLIISCNVRISQGQGRIATETIGIIESLTALAQSEDTLLIRRSREGVTVAVSR